MFNKHIPLFFLFTLVLFTSFTSKAQKANHSIWDQILILNVSNEGKVNYKSLMSDSSLFYKYFTHLTETPPEESWTKEEKLAYWINAYNAIVLKMIIDNYPVENINELHDPWNQRFFRIKDKRYSLDEIEHKILRKMKEPRIHFLINCGANSSPNLWYTAYTAENINQALEDKTREFINDRSKNIITEDKVKISQIFDWYKEDFNNGNVVEFINQYAPLQIDRISKKSYKVYDWTLNEQ